MMDNSLIFPLHGNINDISSLDAENITCCLRFDRALSKVLRKVTDSNNQGINERTLFMLRDHLYCRLPNLANKVHSVFQLFSQKATDISTDSANSLLSEIRSGYFKILSAESVHESCENCDSVLSDVNRIFDFLVDLLLKPEMIPSIRSRCSSGASCSDVELTQNDLQGLEESNNYPELCTSLGLSRYSEVSHADDWRLYFEDSVAQSAKKLAVNRSSKMSRSRSAENVIALDECRLQRRRDSSNNYKNKVDVITPVLPRHLSQDASPLRIHIESPDRFRWDEYDLKQPLVGDSPMITGILKNPTSGTKRSSSSSNITSKQNNNAISGNDEDSYLRTPPPSSLKSDRPPVKIDGLSAEILSATIRRLRIAEQRVSVLEAYNNQLRDDNHSMVKRLRESEELVAALRKQLLANTDQTAKQMEDVLSSQLNALKGERDNLAEAVERLKPLQIQLAGANFEKRLLEEALEQERVAANQWRRDREVMESNLFGLQALVQRQKLQLADADARQNDLSQLIADLQSEKEVASRRIVENETKVTTALRRADHLSADLEAASQRIEQLRNSLLNRDVEIANERARLENEHAVAVEKLRRQLAADLKEKEDQLRNEVENIRHEYVKVMDHAKTVENEKTTALLCIKRIHENELHEFYEQQQKELATVRSEMAARTSQLREEVETAHAAELAELKCQHEEQLRAQRKQLEDMYASQIETLCSDQERVLTESIGKYEGKLAVAIEQSRQIEKESNETIERLGRELEMALANQTQLLNSIAEQDNVIETMRQRLDEQNKELEAAVVERTGLLSQIEQMRQHVESFTEGQVAAAVDNVRSTTEIQIEQLAGQLELAKRQLEDTHQLLVMAGQHNVDLRAAMVSQQQAHAAQLDQQKSAGATESAAINSQAESLKGQLEEICIRADKWKAENGELREQINALLNQVRKPSTADFGCFVQLEKASLEELEAQNRMLASQLAVLYDETKQVQNQMTEMHEAELERINFIHTQKMNEIRVALQLQHSEEIAQLKKMFEAELKQLKEENISDGLISVPKVNTEELESRLVLLKQQYDLDRETAVLKERENLLSEHALVIKQLKADWEIELKKCNFELEMTRTALKNASEERDQLETRVKEYSSQKLEMETKIHEYCTLIEEQRLEFTRRLETEHKDLRSEFENMLQTISSKLEMEAQLKRANVFIDFQQRLDAKVAEFIALREQHGAAMVKAESRIAELQQLADQYIEEKLELEQKFSRERAEFKQEIDRISNSAADNLRSTVRETEDRLAESHQADLKRLERKCEEERRAEVAAITAKYEEDLRQLSDQLNVKMELQLSELSKQTAAIDSAVTQSYREKLASEIAQIERNLAAEFKQREAEAHMEFDRAHEAELSQVEGLWRRRCEEVESQLALKTEQWQRAQEEIEQVQETAKRMAELMASDYEQQLKIALEQAEEKAKSETEMKVNQEKDRIQQEIFDLRDSVEAELRREVETWRGKTEDLERSLQAIQNTLAEVIKARDDALETAKLAANEVRGSNSQSIGVFCLLACLVQHVQVLIHEKTEQLVSRPASEGLIEALALVRASELPSIGESAEDIGLPFQEVQMWIVERFESLLDLVDAALIQSEVDHDFVCRAEKALQERDNQLAHNQKTIKTAEALMQQKLEELAKREEEIEQLKVHSVELMDAVEKLDAELKESNLREMNLIEERSAEMNKQREHIENLHNISIQCEDAADQVAECEALWKQRVAEMDAAASRAIEEYQRQVAADQHRIDELTSTSDRMRIDYEQRLNDLTQNLANKENALKSLRKFMDEQAAEREAEQDEYQKTIINLQQTLSERLRALEIVNNKLAAVDEMQKEMEESSRQLQNSQQRMAELQTMLADTEERLRNETGRFQSRLQSAQAEKLRLENDVTRAKAIISKLEARAGISYSSLDLDNSFGVDRLQQELLETRNRWEAQSSRLEALEAELKLLVEEKRDCLLKMDELKAQLDESQKKLLEAEHACTAALSRFQVDIENREKTINTLKAALSDREIQLQTLETTSRHLLTERDLCGGSESAAQSTPRGGYNGTISPSFTVNSYGGVFPSSSAMYDQSIVAEREREIEHLRALIEELSQDRDRLISEADSARRSLECRLIALEEKLAHQSEDIENRLHHETESVRPETEADLDGFDGESVAAPGSLSIIAAELNQEFELSDKLDAALLRRAGVDSASTLQPTKPSSINGAAYAGLVTPSTSGSSPSGNGSSSGVATASPLVVILQRLEELSSDILRLSDPDTYLLSGVAEGSNMADRLLAIIRKIAPTRSIGVGTEATYIAGALEEMKCHVASLGVRWTSQIDNEKPQAAQQERFGEFIAEISRLLDAAIDQIVPILVNASSDNKHVGNVDAVRQLVHVTTQLSSDFSAAERQALTADCQTLAIRIRELESDLSKERRDLMDANKQLEEFHEKLRTQAGEVSHLQARLDEEQQQRMESSSICDRLKSQLDESYAEIERARRYSDLHYTSMHELENVKRSHDSTLQQLREKQSEIDQFDSKLAQIKQAFTQQLERQQAANARSQADADANREKASRLQVELVDAKRALDLASHERERLQAEIDRLLGVMADQERRTLDITDRYNQAEVERCRLVADLEALRDEHTRIEMRLSAKSDANTRQLKESLHRMESENEIVRQELLSAETRCSCLARDLDRALAASAQSEDRIAALSQQLDSRLAEVGRLSARLTELEAAGITQSEFERLRQRLQARDSACERAIEQTSALRARLAEMTARLTPIRTQMLLAAARANAIVASVSTEAVKGTYSSHNSVSVSVAGQLESGLRMAANELDQLISPITSTSNGAAVFDPEDALSPPPMFEDNGDFERPLTGQLKGQHLAGILAQNKELGDTVYKLSCELRQSRRCTTNDQLESRAFSPVNEANEKNLATAKQQLRELTAKYVRAEGHRKALIYQKRYLMLVIGDFRDTERQILIKLKAMDNPKMGDRILPKSWHSRASASLAKPTNGSAAPILSPLSPLGRFKAAASSIIFMHRTKKLARKWRKFSANVATKMSENLTKPKNENVHLTNSAAPTSSVMSLFTSSANRRPTSNDHTSAGRTVLQDNYHCPTVSNGKLHNSKALSNNQIPISSDICFTMTASSHNGLSGGHYDLATSSLAAHNAMDAATFNHAAHPTECDDSYLTRLEMVRNQLRECRTTSGTATSNVFSKR